MMIAAPATVAGEVKTSASEFTDEQVRRDVALSLRLGADIHVMGALDHLPISALNHAKALTNASDMQLIVVQADNNEELIMRTF